MGDGPGTGMNGARQRRGLALGVTLLLLALLGLSSAPGPARPILGPTTVAAATPSPSTAGGDLRSSGEGAGAAGNPGFALVAGLAVLGAGVLIAGATTLYVRMTERRDAG